MCIYITYSRHIYRFLQSFITYLCMYITSSRGIYRFYLTTAVFPVRKNILFDNLKCLEPHWIFRKVAPLKICFESLTLLTFFVLCSVDQICINCMVCQDQASPFFASVALPINVLSAETLTSFQQYFSYNNPVCFAELSYSVNPRIFEIRVSFKQGRFCEV